MKEECLICKAPLEYLEADVLMECGICHKKELSKTRCVNGHYVCSDCHTRGLDTIIGLCMAETSKDPHRDHRKNDGHAVLPYARAGASRDGGRRAADRL